MINVLLFVLAAANLFGTGLGLIFYYMQIKAANPLLWIFIPDCPLYIFLATLCYLKLVKGELLRTAIASGLLKYGIWTIFVLLYYSSDFMVDWIGPVLLVEHVGMAAQFAFFAKRFEKKHLAIAAGWFLLNDFADYVLGVHPYLTAADLGIIPAFTVALSLLVPLFMLLAGERVEKLGIVGWTKGLFGLSSF